MAVLTHHEPHLHGRGKYIKSLVYGGLDGIITTFAVVAGVAGASLSANIVLILGFANLVGDGLSMAIGDFLSTRAEQAYHKEERRRERWEIDHQPEKEYGELLEFYRKKGFSEQDTHELARIISKNPEAMLDVMMVEELGILQDGGSPLKSALVTFSSFLGFGLVPLLAYLIAVFFPFSPVFGVATLLTAVTLFTLGSVKVRITGQNWLRAGGEMLAVGGIAATAAYVIGYALSLLV